MQKKISFVITCYNYGRYLEQAVKSCTGQALANGSSLKPEDLEVLIIDDESEDGSIEVARRVADSSSIIPIRTYELKHSGRSHARNYGLSKADGEFVVFLDADDFLEPKFAWWTYRSIEVLPEAPFAYTYYFLYNPPYRLMMKPAEFSLKQLADRAFILVTALIRKELLDRIGGFHEQLNRLEDWDLYLRLCQYGMPHVVPIPLFSYRRHKESSTACSRKKAQQIGAYYKLVKENWKDRYQNIDFEEFKSSIPKMWVPCDDCATNGCSRKFPEGSPKCCNECEMRHQCAEYECLIFNVAGRMENPKVKGR